MDELSVLSSGFVTWIAVAACVVSMYVISFTVLKDPNNYEILRAMAGAGLIAVIVLLLFTPILQTRSRFIQVKSSERKIATNGLGGTRVANGQLAIVSDGPHYSATELLIYLRYLDSLWEWPIRRNLARLIFYALIPPIAWVLSALVEITLSFQLQ